MTFHRRHYDKALLIVVSTLKYWQENTQPMHEVIQQFLVALHKYPVENFILCFEQGKVCLIQQNKLERRLKRLMPVKKKCMNLSIATSEFSPDSEHDETKNTRAALV